MITGEAMAHLPPLTELHSSKCQSSIRGSATWELTWHSLVRPAAALHTTQTPVGLQWALFSHLISVHTLCLPATFSPWALTCCPQAKEVGSQSWQWSCRKAAGLTVAVIDLLPKRTLRLLLLSVAPFMFSFTWTINLLCVRPLGVLHVRSLPQHPCIEVVTVPPPYLSKASLPPKDLIWALFYSGSCPVQRF